MIELLQHSSVDETVRKLLAKDPQSYIVKMDIESD